MELKIALLLLLSGWTQQSAATNCTAYLSSPPLTLNLLCPSAICRLEIANMRSCINNCPSCNIADCNKAYSLCNNVSSESSPQEPSGIQHIVSSSEQLISCTFVVVNTMISVTCQKGDYQLTFRSTTSACTRDLGINCNQDNPVATCIRTYHFCQPNTCQPLRKIVHTTVLNQCSRSECCTNEVTACPSPTLTMHVSGTTNVLNMSSTASTNCPSVTPRLPDSRIRASTVNGAIIPVTGALVGLLVMLLTVVTTGWVYTCSRRTELGLRSQSISNETELDLNDNPAYATKTIRQRDLAHGVTNISKGTELSQAVTDELVPTYETVLPSSAQIETRHGSQSGKDMNQQEPTYEIVQQPSAQVSGQKKEDEYDKLNRELL